MRKIDFAACLVVSTLSLSGCGTLCNFGAAILPQREDGPAFPQVYGGVALDATALVTPRAFPINSDADAKGAAFVAAFILADLPVSFVGDTLTLPITLALHRRRAESNSPSRGNDATPIDPEIRARAPSTALGNLGEPHQGTWPPSPEDLRLGNNQPYLSFLPQRHRDTERADRNSLLTNFEGREVADSVFYPFLSSPCLGASVVKD